MDPLEALRSNIAKGKKLERANGNVIIGKYAFPDKTYTCMKKLNAYEKHELFLDKDLTKQAKLANINFRANS